MDRKIFLTKAQIETVDGVRALAVLAVIALHFKNVWLGAGGPVALLTTPGAGGVIIFFVVSGFCITLSKKSSESWVGFYLRRAFRLLPACWFSLALYLSVLKLVWNKTIPFQGVLGSFMVLPNWFGETVVSGLYKPANELNPVLWSLQTEIELYLLFPLSLLLFRALPRRAFLAVTLVTSLIAWAIWLKLQPSFTYFPPYPALCHWFVWNLGLYLCFLSNDGQSTQSRDLWISSFGLASGALLILLRNATHSNALSFWYFFTGLGAFFFLRWALAAAPRLLRYQAMTYVGKRSYSLYLNHWPAAITGTLLFNSKGAAALFGLVALVTITEFSYRFIELPFIALGKRFAGALNTPKAFGSSVASPSS